MRTPSGPSAAAVRVDPMPYRSGSSAARARIRRWAAVARSARVSAVAPQIADTATSEATSPAGAPPMPSATAKTGGRTRTASSFWLRRRPGSLAAACSAMTTRGGTSAGDPDAIDPPGVARLDEIRRAGAVVDVVGVRGRGAQRHGGRVAGAARGAEVVEGDRAQRRRPALERAAPAELGAEVVGAQRPGRAEAVGGLVGVEGPDGGRGIRRGGGPARGRLLVGGGRRPFRAALGRRGGRGGVVTGGQDDRDRDGRGRGRGQGEDEGPGAAGSGPGGPGLRRRARR